jgi:DNA polymerase I-like protein with 3'-5' exonuclease and polymerase domains
MKIYDTSLLSPTDLDPTERDYVYNGLDCAVTAEVLEVLLPQLDNQTSATYAFSRSLQGPVLEMRLRGVLVDKARKAEVIDEYHDKLEVLERNLERIVLEGVGMPHFNWRSNDHLKDLFYERLGIPAIRRQGRVTVNRDALERMEAYTIARPIIAHLIAMRELGKRISVLKTDIDPDGRIRTSYNIAGSLRH